MPRLGPPPPGMMPNEATCGRPHANDAWAPNDETSCLPHDGAHLARNDSTGQIRRWEPLYTHFILLVLLPRGDHDAVIGCFLTGGQGRLAPPSYQRENNFGRGVCRNPDFFCKDKASPSASAQLILKK
ncbi:hypothetical protein GH733_009078 [Mirounga leonina]|nr:hypothetical protein GH733_009078 [Mirounga leonina]